MRRGFIIKANGRAKRFINQTQRASAMMTRRTLITAGAAIAATTLAGEANAAHHIGPPRAGFKVFDGRGQSLFEGGGQPPLARDIPADHPTEVSVFTKGNRFFQGFMPYSSTQAAYGGSEYRDVWPPGDRQGIGPGIYMLDRACGLAPGTQNLCLLPNARSATPLFQMMPGSAIWKAAEDRLKRVEDFGGVTSCLYFDGCQGDTHEKKAAFAICSRLEDFVGEYRRLRGKNVPFIFADLGDQPPRTQGQYGHWSTARAQLAQAERVIPNSIKLAAQGLPTTDDVHRSPDAQRIMGEAAAMAYLVLAGIRQ